MAEEDVDIAALSDDEVVDLTVDGDDWDDIEVGPSHMTVYRAVETLPTDSCWCRISAILNKTSRRQPLRTPDRARTCRCVYDQCLHGSRQQVPASKL